MLKLYGFAVSNYYNMVKLALLEKGVVSENELAAVHPRLLVRLFASPLGVRMLAAGELPEPSQDLDGTVAWLSERPLKAGARVLVKHGTKTTQAIMTSITAVTERHAGTARQTCLNVSGTKAVAASNSTMKVL